MPTRPASGPLLKLWTAAPPPNGFGGLGTVLTGPAAITSPARPNKWLEEAHAIVDPALDASGCSNDKAALTEGSGNTEGAALAVAETIAAQKGTGFVKTFSAIPKGHGTTQEIESAS